MTSPTLRSLIITAAIVLSACAAKGELLMTPESQQQVQDTVIGHLRRTLAVLPPGTALDATRFPGAGHNSYCTDDDSGPSASMRFHTIGELTLPIDTDRTDLIAAVGDIWRHWGWQVHERDGFRRPNRFGYGPDGYRLQIVAAAAPGHPPTLRASSPCFPRQIARDDIPIPEVLRIE